MQLMPKTDSLVHIRSDRYLLLALVLVALFLRIHRLTLFPGFVDEGMHIQWARGM